MTYNPNAPSTIGNEWRVHTEGVDALDAQAKAVGLLIPSSGVETIDSLVLAHQWAGAASGYGRKWVDLYNLASSPVITDSMISELTYKPNEDKTKSGVTKSDFGTTSNLYQAIDDTDDSGPPENTDYIVNSNYWTSGSYAGFQFDTAAILNTYRILSVSFEVRAKGFDWSWQAPSIYLEWYNGSSRVGRFGTINPPQDYVFRTYTFGPFFFDLYNEGKWLQPEIANLDVNTSRNLRLVLNYACAVSRVTMKVKVCTENRVAVGLCAKQTTLPSGVQTALPMSLKTPLNVDNFAKANALNYLAVVSRLEDPLGTLTTLQPQIIYLDAVTQADPQAKADGYSVTLRDASGAISAYSASGTKAYAAVLGTSGGAQSADSQPYYDLDAQPCHATSTLKQGVNGASAQSYRRVRFLVGVSTTPTASLSVKVKKVSDNSQVGGTGTLAVADLSDSAVATLIGTRTLYDGRSMSVYDVTITLASTATLAGATDYYLEFTSTTTEEWFLLWLNAASYGLTGNNTYGGTTDQATVAGSGTATADFLATLSSVPTAPLTCTASALEIALPDNGDTICPEGVLEEAHVVWTTSGAVTGFSYYEVQRSLDGGATWEALATVTAENTKSLEDQEVTRGVAVKYRVRVVRTDGAFSDWTESGSVTLDATPGMILFVSNADPTIACGYVLAQSEQQYQFPSAGETVFMRLYNRDFQIAVKPTEDRGVTWSFPLIVFHGGHEGLTPPTGEGVQAFDLLRAAALAEVPYLCMLTPKGERFFGTLQVPSGRHLEPGKTYIAEVAFTQTQSAPTSVELP